MHTDNDIKDNVYQLLQSSQLKAAVSGEIRKIARSPHSMAEDVIISVLANDNPRQIQQAFVNVNVYVRDKKLMADNEAYYVEDTARTKVIARIVADMFAMSITGENYRLSLDSQRVLAVDATHEHVINNRLLYKCVNEY